MPTIAGPGGVSVTIPDALMAAGDPAAIASFLQERGINAPVDVTQADADAIMAVADAQRAREAEVKRETSWGNVATQMLRGLPSRGVVADVSAFPVIVQDGAEALGVPAQAIETLVDIANVVTPDYREGWVQAIRAGAGYLANRAAGLAALAQPAASAGLVDQSTIEYPYRALSEFRDGMPAIGPDSLREAWGGEGTTGLERGIDLATLLTRGYLENAPQLAETVATMGALGPASAMSLAPTYLGELGDIYSGAIDEGRPGMRALLPAAAGATASTALERLPIGWLLKRANGAAGDPARSLARTVIRALPEQLIGEPVTEGLQEGINIAAQRAGGAQERGWDDIANQIGTAAYMALGPGAVQGVTGGVGEYIDARRQQQPAPQPAPTVAAPPRSTPISRDEALRALVAMPFTGSTSPAPAGTPVTPGNPLNPPSPDPANVVAEQIRFAQDPAAERAAVLFTPGTVIPWDEDGNPAAGLEAALLPKHGTVWYNPAKVSRDAIIAAGSQDVFDPKMIFGKNAPQPPAAGNAVVTASVPGADNVAASVVNTADPNAVAQTAAAVQAAHPGATVTVKDAAEVQAGRGVVAPQPTPAVAVAPTSNRDEIDAFIATPGNAANDAIGLDSVTRWDKANRGRRSDAWFEGGNIEGRAGFDAAHAAGASALQAHGMSKVGTLSKGVRDLLAMLKGGLDPARRGGVLDTAPLTAAAGEGLVGSTASGTAYRDGPFILVAKPGQALSGNLDGLGAVLVNDAHQDIVPRLRELVEKIRPGVLVDTFSNAGNVTRSLIAPPAAPAAGVSVPLTITTSVRQGLADLGYTREQVNAMRPEDAQDILAQQRMAPAAPVAPSPTPAPVTAPTPSPQRDAFRASVLEDRDMLSAAEAAKKPKQAKDWAAQLSASLGVPIATVADAVKVDINQAFDRHVAEGKVWNENTFRWESAPVATPTPAPAPTPEPTVTLTGRRPRRKKGGEKDEGKTEGQKEEGVQVAPATPAVAAEPNAPAAAAAPETPAPEVAPSSPAPTPAAAPDVPITGRRRRSKATAATPASTPAVETAAAAAPAADPAAAAQQQIVDGLADLVDAFTPKLNVVADAEPRIVKALVKIFDGVIKLGAIKFKEAAGKVMDFIREKSPDSAKAITDKNLRDAYLEASAGVKGADSKKTVSAVKLSEISGEPVKKTNLADGHPAVVKLAPLEKWLQGEVDRLSKAGILGAGNPESTALGISFATRISDREGVLSVFSAARRGRPFAAAELTLQLGDGPPVNINPPPGYIYVPEVGAYILNPNVDPAIVEDPVYAAELAADSEANLVELDGWVSEFQFSDLDFDVEQPFEGKFDRAKVQAELAALASRTADELDKANRRLARSRPAFRRSAEEARRLAGSLSEMQSAAAKVWDLTSQIELKNDELQKLKAANDERASAVEGEIASLRSRLEEARKAEQRSRVVEQMELTLNSGRGLDQFAANIEADEQKHLAGELGDKPVLVPDETLTVDVQIDYDREEAGGLGASRGAFFVKVLDTPRNLEIADEHFEQVAAGMDATEWDEMDDAGKIEALSNWVRDQHLGGEMNVGSTRRLTPKIVYDSEKSRRIESAWELAHKHASNLAEASAASRAYDEASDRHAIVSNEKATTAFRIQIPSGQKTVAEYRATEKLLDKWIANAAAGQVTAEMKKAGMSDARTAGIVASHARSEIRYRIAALEARQLMLDPAFKAWAKVNRLAHFSHGDIVAGDNERFRLLTRMIVSTKLLEYDDPESARRAKDHPTVEPSRKEQDDLARILDDGAKENATPAQKQAAADLTMDQVLWGRHRQITRRFDTLDALSRANYRARKAKMAEIERETAKGKPPTETSFEFNARISKLIDEMGVLRTEYEQKILAERRADSARKAYDEAMSELGRLQQLRDWMSVRAQDDTRRIEGKTGLDRMMASLTAAMPRQMTISDLDRQIKAAREKASKLRAAALESTTFPFISAAEKGDSSGLSIGKGDVHAAWGYVGTPIEALDRIEEQLGLHGYSYVGHYDPMARDRAVIAKLPLPERVMTMYYRSGMRAAYLAGGSTNRRDLASVTQRIAELEKERDQAEMWVGSHPEDSATAKIRDRASELIVSLRRRAAVLQRKLGLASTEEIEARARRIAELQAQANNAEPDAKAELESQIEQLAKANSEVAARTGTRDDIADRFRLNEEIASLEEQIAKALKAKKPNQIVIDSLRKQVADKKGELAVIDVAPPADLIMPKLARAAARKYVIESFKALITRMQAPQRDRLIAMDSAAHGMLSAERTLGADRKSARVKIRKSTKSDGILGVMAETVMRYQPWLQPGGDRIAFDAMLSRAYDAYAKQLSEGAGKDNPRGVPIPPLVSLTNGSYGFSNGITIKDLAEALGGNEATPMSDSPTAKIHASRLRALMTSHVSGGEAKGVSRSATSKYVMVTIPGTQGVAVVPVSYRSMGKGDTTMIRIMAPRGGGYKSGQGRSAFKPGNFVRLDHLASSGLADANVVGVVTFGPEHAFVSASPIVLLRSEANDILMSGSAEAREIMDSVHGRASVGAAVENESKMREWRHKALESSDEGAVDQTTEEEYNARVARAQAAIRAEEEYALNHGGHDGTSVLDVWRENIARSSEERDALSAAGDVGGILLAVADQLLERNLDVRRFLRDTAFGNVDLNLFGAINTLRDKLATTGSDALRMPARRLDRSTDAEEAFVLDFVEAIKKAAYEYRESEGSESNEGPDGGAQEEGSEDVIGDRQAGLAVGIAKAFGISTQGSVASAIRRRTGRRRGVVSTYAPEAPEVTAAQMSELQDAWKKGQVTRDREAIWSEGRGKEVQVATEQAFLESAARANRPIEWVEVPGEAARKVILTPEQGRLFAVSFDASNGSRPTIPSWWDVKIERSDRSATNGRITITDHGMGAADRSTTRKYTHSPMLFIPDLDFRAINARAERAEVAGEIEDLIAAEEAARNSEAEARASAANSEWHNQLARIAALDPLIQNRTQNGMDPSKPLPKSAPSVPIRKGEVVTSWTQWDGTQIERRLAIVDEQANQQRLAEEARARKAAEDLEAGARARAEQLAREGEYAETEARLGVPPARPRRMGVIRPTSEVAAEIRSGSTQVPGRDYPILTQAEARPQNQAIGERIVRSIVRPTPRAELTPEQRAYELSFQQWLDRYNSDPKVRENVRFNLREAPPENPWTVDQVREEILRRTGWTEIPSGLRIVSAPEVADVAGMTDSNSGAVFINAAGIGSADDVAIVLNEEMMHRVWNDADVAEAREALVAEARKNQELYDAVREIYGERGERAVDEEAAIDAAQRIVEAASDSLISRLMSKIEDAVYRLPILGRLARVFRLPSTGYQARYLISRAMAAGNRPISMEGEQVSPFANQQQAVTSPNEQVRDGGDRPGVEDDTGTEDGGRQEIPGGAGEQSGAADVRSIPEVRALRENVGRLGSPGSTAIWRSAGDLAGVLGVPEIADTDPYFSHPEFIEKGMESVVLFDEGSGTMIKAADPYAGTGIVPGLETDGPENVLMKLWVSRVDPAFVPNTLKGTTKMRGKVRVVFEQPYIDGLRRAPSSQDVSDRHKILRQLGLFPIKNQYGSEAISYRSGELVRVYDLNAGNVLFDAAGAPHIIDFMAAPLSKERAADLIADAIEKGIATFDDMPADMIESALAAGAPKGWTIAQERVDRVRDSFAKWKAARNTGPRDVRFNLRGRRLRSQREVNEIIEKLQAAGGQTADQVASVIREAAAQQHMIPEVYSAEVERMGSVSPAAIEGARGEDLRISMKAERRAGRQLKSVLQLSRLISGEFGAVPGALRDQAASIDAMPAGTPEELEAKLRALDQLMAAGEGVASWHRFLNHARVKAGQDVIERTKELTKAEADFADRLSRADAGDAVDVEAEALSLKEDLMEWLDQEPASQTQAGFSAPERERRAAEATVEAMFGIREVTNDLISILNQASTNPAYRDEVTAILDNDALTVAQQRDALLAGPIARVIADHPEIAASAGTQRLMAPDRALGGRAPITRWLSLASTIRALRSAHHQRAEAAELIRRTIAARPSLEGRDGSVVVSNLVSHILATHRKAGELRAKNRASTSKIRRLRVAVDTGGIVTDFLTRLTADPQYTQQVSDAAQYGDHRYHDIWKEGESQNTETAIPGSEPARGNQVVPVNSIALKMPDGTTRMFEMGVSVEQDNEMRRQLGRAAEDIAAWLDAVAAGRITADPIAVRTYRGMVLPKIGQAISPMFMLSGGQTWGSWITGIFVDPKAKHAIAAASGSILEALSRDIGGQHARNLRSEMDALNRIHAATKFLSDEWNKLMAAAWKPVAAQEKIGEKDFLKAQAYVDNVTNGIAAKNQDDRDRGIHVGDRVFRADTGAWHVVTSVDMAFADKLKKWNDKVRATVEGRDSRSVTFAESLRPARVEIEQGQEGDLGAVSRLATSPGRHTAARTVKPEVSLMASRWMVAVPTAVTNRNEPGPRDWETARPELYRRFLATDPSTGLPVDTEFFRHLVLGHVMEDNQGYDARHGSPYRKAYDAVANRLAQRDGPEPKNIDELVELIRQADEAIKAREIPVGMDILDDTTPALPPIDPVAARAAIKARLVEEVQNAMKALVERYGTQSAGNTVVLRTASDEFNTARGQLPAPGTMFRYLPATEAQMYGRIASATKHFASRIDAAIRTTRDRLGEVITAEKRRIDAGQPQVYTEEAKRAGRVYHTLADLEYFDEGLKNQQTFIRSMLEEEGASAKSMTRLLASYLGFNTALVLSPIFSTIAVTRDLISTSTFHLPLMMHGMGQGWLATVLRAPGNLGMVAADLARAVADTKVGRMFHGIIPGLATMAATHAQMRAEQIALGMADQRIANGDLYASTMDALSGDLNQARQAGGVQYAATRARRRMERWTRRQMVYRAGAEDTLVRIASVNAQRMMRDVRRNAYRSLKAKERRGSLPTNPNDPAYKLKPEDVLGRHVWIAQDPEIVLRNVRDAFLSTRGLDAEVYDWYSKVREMSEAEALRVPFDQTAVDAVVRTVVGLSTRPWMTTLPMGRYANGFLGSLVSAWTFLKGQPSVMRTSLARQMGRSTSRNVLARNARVTMAAAAGLLSVLAGIILSAEVPDELRAAAAGGGRANVGIGEMLEHPDLFGKWATDTALATNLLPDVAAFALGVGVRQYDPMDMAGHVFGLAVLQDHVRAMAIGVNHGSPVEALTYLARRRVPNLNYAWANMANEGDAQALYRAYRRLGEKEDLRAPFAGGSAFSVQSKESALARKAANDIVAGNARSAAARKGQLVGLLRKRGMKADEAKRSAESRIRSQMPVRRAFEATPTEREISVIRRRMGPRERGLMRREMGVISVRQDR